MGSFPKGVSFVTDASCNIGAVRIDRFAHRAVLSRLPLPAASSEGSTLNRADRSLMVTARNPPRILLVDSARRLHGLHLALLRSIPAHVETLTSCSDLYFHEERAYALVILAPHPRSKEAAEAAQFVRHRWSAAKILLLESESALIDDWLYDDRTEPHLHPAAIRGAAIGLMSQQEYWIRA
jgi:hypothetical protein